MILRLIHHRAAAAVAVLAVGTVLAVPGASAGIRDSLANAADAIGCSTKAVFNPMRAVEWGFKNIERVTGREFERYSEKPIKEALKECEEAAESIITRGFGTKGLVGALRSGADRAQSAVQSARSAANRISGWFRKDAASPRDGRMALSVAAREREYYEKETGVLGRGRLPAAQSSWTRDDSASLRAGAGTGWGNGDDDRDAHDPWSDDDASDPWGRGSEARPPADGNLDAVVEAPRPSGGESADSTYAAALSSAFGGSGQAPEGDYGSALAALERHEEDARRAAEVERRQAELARQQAEREDELARQRAASEAARMQAEAVAARRAERQSWIQLGATIAQGVATIAAIREGNVGPGGVPSLPGSGSNAWLPQLPTTPGLPTTSGFSTMPGLPTTEGLFESRPSYSAADTVSGAGTGSSGGTGSSDCQQDITPTCRQVAATIESRVASLQARLNTGGLSMSQTYELGAEVHKVLLDHLPTCYATETRPHCRALNEQDLANIRQAYESARESARQARGG